MLVNNLLNLNDDVLIHIFAFLIPPDILRSRKTCKRLWTISNLRIVWANACSNYVLSKGFPFPDVHLQDMTSIMLERRTVEAFRLAQSWLLGTSLSRKSVTFDATSGTPVGYVRFLPGHPQIFFTISLSIWSTITLWDLSDDPPRMCSPWSRRGAIFQGICLNTDHHSEALLAVSYPKGGPCIELLQMYYDQQNVPNLRTLTILQTRLRPVALAGDLLATSDDVAQTVVWNWKTGKQATLHHPADVDGVWQANRCIQVIFAYKSILVVRARSIHLYLEPTLHGPEEEPLVYQPVAGHSFGWVESASVTLSPRTNLSQNLHPSLSILIRAECDDAWNSDIHTLRLYTLFPNPDFSPEIASQVGALSLASNEGHRYPLDISSISPYIFPPTHTAEIKAIHGPLRLASVVLGRYGTALWVQPPDNAPNGLIWSSDQGPFQAIASKNPHESLVAAVFPGPLAPHLENHDYHKGILHLSGRTLFTNPLNHWTAIDYDEVTGRVALGSRFGRVTIFYL